MNNRAGVFAITLIMLLVSGCASTVKPYRYYALQPLADNKAQTFEGEIGVNPIVIPEWMDQPNLIWSDGQFRLYRADVDRWGEPLTHAITRVTTENLKVLSGGARVSQGPWLKSLRPERTVAIELLSLAQVENQIVLDVRWTVSEKDRKGFSHRQKFARDSKNYRPERMAEYFSLLLSDMATVIGRQLKVKPIINIDKPPAMPG